MNQNNAAQCSSFEDLRAAPRFSLMLRAAKLVGESGQYLCIVRDVSESGTKLKLFHAPPDETHLFLELANGARYAVERVWSGDGHVGFRFAAPIVVDEFIEEAGPHQRRPLRLKIEREGLVHVAGLASAAFLHDLSQQGARIEAGCHIAIGQQLRLEVPGLPPRVARARWRQGQTYGLAFEETFRLDELARLLHSLTITPADIPVAVCA